ncbi:MAG: hypothetical protein EPN85_03290 [Bacteroidetes bacterium]|nr:MAG: hypothetical protein EPN85_03290 [Bacteroidota bacterium]
MKIGDILYNEQLSIVMDMALEQWFGTAPNEIVDAIIAECDSLEPSSEEIFEAIRKNDELKFHLVSFLFGQITLICFERKQYEFYKIEAEGRLSDMLPNIPKF